MGDVLVELLVLVLADIVARPGPQRFGGVDGFEFGLGGVLLFPLLFLRHPHRHGNVVGVAPHHRAQTKAVRELAGVVLEVQGHARAPGRRLHALDGELFLAVGLPARRLLLSGAPRQHVHFLGDDERTVEADPELADQRAVLALIAGQLREELLGAGLGDGAEVLDDFGAAHADAVVLDRHRRRILVELHEDVEVGIVGDQRIVLQRLEAQPVDGVGGIGDQLAQKNLPVRVQGVDHQLEQLAGFRLEAEGLGGFGHGKCRRS